MKLILFVAEFLKKHWTNHVGRRGGR